MNKIIPISQPSITQKEIEYVTDAVQSGWVSSLGKYIDQFESAFAKYCNVKYALTTSNGTTALHLALLSMGVSEGDEVIIPDMTFIATANAVRYVGANVVFADIEEDSLCISPESIRSLISSKTKAIIPVHLYGHPADMQAIHKLSKEFNLKVIEDAAEAHGADIDGKKVGSFGDCGVFSFYGNKLITSGEGGMITTNDYVLYKKMKCLRDHAMSEKKRYWHTEVGYNYRMTNLQAALGVAQLERIDDFIYKKKEIFSWYENELKSNKKIKLNFTSDDCNNVYWMICVQIRDFTESQRNMLLAELKNKYIDGRPFFYPVSDMPMYKAETNNDTVISHRVYKSGINVPSFYDITKSDVKYISKTLVEIISSL